MVFEGAGCAIVGPDADRFRATPTLTDLPAGGERAIEVAFSPLSAGSKRATMVLTTSDPERPVVRIELSGRGVVRTGPASAVDWRAYSER